MKKQILLLVMMFLPMVSSVNVFAYDIAVENADGKTIYYNYINNDNELEVTSGGPKYSGNVVIPEEVTFMSRTRRVTSIGDYAFCRCSGLTSVTIPNSVTSIGYSAFRGCHFLTSITIPNSVTSIDNDVFCNCTGLTSVTIGNGVTYIGNGTFEECYRLTSVTIGNSVTSIRGGAFYNCSSLVSFTIPNSVTYIGHSAFAGCRSLTSITIGNSVTYIDYDAFQFCDGLTSVQISDIAAWCKISFNTSQSNPLYYAHHLFINNEEIKDLIIPNSVTSIEDYAFCRCSGLTSVTIPNSVTHIGHRAFDGYALTTVVSQIESPFAITGMNSGDRTFSKNTFNEAILYVPVGTLNKYETTDGWKDFSFKVADTPAGVFNIPAQKLLIQSDGGILTIQGADDGELVTIYTIDGTQHGRGVCQNGSATIVTSLNPGAVAIVKVGDKSVKNVMK
jgi:hypothetical protein